MKLVFKGWQEDGVGGKFKMWDVVDSQSPFNKSTMSLEGLIEYGLINKAKEG